MISFAYKTMVARKSFTAAEIKIPYTNLHIFDVFSTADMLLSNDGYECGKEPLKNLYNFRIEYVNKDEGQLKDDERRKIILASRMDDIEKGDKVKRLTHEWEFRCPETEAISHINRLRLPYLMHRFDIGANE